MLGRDVTRGRSSKIPLLRSAYWITMMNKILVSHSELVTLVNWDKTEMEESKTEGSAQLVNNGLRHRWS